MRHLISAAALIALLAPPLQAADGLSGAWTSAGGAGQTYVFKVQGDRFTGIVCGPCDDPAAVFRIEDGKILDADRLTFSINYDVGGPQFKQYGPYRDQVTATRSGNQLAIRAQRQGATQNPLGDVLKRVVDNYAGLSLPAAATGAIAPRSSRSRRRLREDGSRPAGSPSRTSFSRSATTRCGDSSAVPAIPRASS